MQCVEIALQRASAAARVNMRRGMRSLASVTGTASFVGFFGTVLGIMNSFQSLGTSKSAALAALTGRLSDAMAPGILGLFVAAMAFWFHQYLSSRAQAFELEMKNASVDLINRLIVNLERLRISTG